MKPWMDNKDIHIIEKTLLGLGKKNINVLEWGAGGSTEYFTGFLKAHGIKYNWTSIEYNKVWAEKVLTLKIPDVSIVLFDVGNNALRQKYTNMDDYVKYPTTLNKKFDFILIDGRKRRRCLINSSKLLNTGSVVMLHDAQRKYYHCAFANFKTSIFLSTTLWMGKNE